MQFCRVAHRERCCAWARTFIPAPHRSITSLPKSYCVTINSVGVNCAWKKSVWTEISSLCWLYAGGNWRLTGENPWLVPWRLKGRRGTLKQLLKQLADEVIHHLRSLWRRLWLLTRVPGLKLTLLYKSHFSTAMQRYLFDHSIKKRLCVFEWFQL